MSLNKVILIGNLGKDPEVRYMPNGEAVTNFSIATSESWNDKNTGQKVDRTEWHNIVLYGRLAEIAGQYLKKGRQVYIEGRIQSRKYTGKDGMERTAYEIVAREMQMLGNRNDNVAPFDTTNNNYNNEQKGNSNYSTSYQTEQNNNSYTASLATPIYNNTSTSSHTTPPAPKWQAPSTPVTPQEDLDDDIPF